MVDSDGRRHIHLLIEPGVYRVRALPIGIRIDRPDGTVEIRRPGDPIRERIALAAKDPAVAKAIRLRDVEGLGWVELYRLYEVIEGDVGGRSKITQRGWASAKEQRRFKHTADSVGAAGDEARHGRQGTQPPANPMKLSEARELVDHLLQSWLRSKVEAG